jgi:hypothetical protein
VVEVDGWTSVFQRVSKRIANVLRERETGRAAAFPGHDERRLLPVEIGEAPSDDITATKSSTGHQQADGLIAGSSRGGWITRGDDPFDGLGREVLWQR